MHTEPDAKFGPTKVVGLFYPHGRESSSVVARAICEAVYDGVDVRFITGEPCDYRGSGSVKDDRDFHRMEFAVSIGGDGTFLRAGRLVRELGIPLFGINTGRLGFLASGNPDSAVEDVSRIISGGFSLQKRIPLRCALYKEKTYHEFYALNEFTVAKAAASRPIEMRVCVGGELLYDLHADGVIVSTPTGSTAYSLSAGGPIVHPDVCGTIIVPICPHSLYPRPIILGNDMPVEISFTGENDRMYLSADGQINMELSGADVVVIETDREHAVGIIKLDNSSYLDVLRDKLNWGLGNNNSRRSAKREKCI